MKTRKTERSIALLALIPGAYVLSYLFFTEGGLWGISNWIFPTGLVAFFMFLLGGSIVIKEFKTKGNQP
jgi:hypothetical protein